MAALTDINGVGPSRAMRLANAGYGNVEAVADASVDELRAVVGVSIAAAEAMILGARELAPDGASTDATPEAADDVADPVPEPDGDADDAGDIIDRIAAQIVGGRKQRKRIVREVSKEIAARLAKPLRKELGVKRLKTKQVRDALATVVAKELGK